VSLREEQRHATRRLLLLEAEAGVQRVALAATFATLEKRRALEWSGKAASWAYHLLATPRVSWLVVANVLSRLGRKWAR
jgi:hypothetical protein